MAKYKGSHLQPEGNKNDSVTPKKRRKLLITIGIILAVVLVQLVIAYAVFDHFYSKMNIHTGISDEELQQAIENYNPVDYYEPEDKVSPDEIGDDVTVLTEEETLTFEDELRAQVESADGEVLSDNNVINILLIGTDSRTGELKSRSDTMMLVSLNKNTKQITLTSFARDIYTYIPDLGYSNRLNVPCRMGGPTMLVSTMKQVFGIEIDGYVMVNFFSFIDVVDALGGVDIELREEEIWYLNTNLEEQNNLQGQSRKTDKLASGTSGLVHLNGNQALAYSRIRKLDGDSARTARQRAVIEALIEKAKGMSLTELYDLVNVVLPMVATDLSQTDCLSILVNAFEYLSYDIQSLRIPEEGTYFLAMVNEMSVIKMDFDAAKALLKEKIYGITE